MFTIDFEEPTTTLCKCCGGIETQLQRGIYLGDVMVAFYMATIPGHPGLPISVLAFWGDFGDDAPQSARTAATFSVFNVPAEDGYGTSITDPAEAGWPPSDMATFISQEEALRDYSDKLYAFSDLILDKDMAIRNYLDVAVTTH